MDSFLSLMHGFSVVLVPGNFIYMVIGILLGVLIGVLPGLGAANGIAILLPLTFGMSPDIGDHHAFLHLLGSLVRRRHRFDPVQHSG